MVISFSVSSISFSCNIFSFSFSKCYVASNPTTSIAFNTSYISSKMSSLSVVLALGTMSCSILSSHCKVFCFLCSLLSTSCLDFSLSKSPNYPIACELIFIKSNPSRITNIVWLLSYGKYFLSLVSSKSGVD